MTRNLEDTVAKKSNFCLIKSHLNINTHSLHMLIRLIHVHVLSTWCHIYSSIIST